MYKLNYFIILDNKSKKLIFKTKDYTSYIRVKEILKKYPIVCKNDNQLKLYHHVYVPNYSFLLDNYLYLPLEIISEIRSYCTSNYEYRSKIISSYYDLCYPDYFSNYYYYDGYYIIYKLSDNTYSMQMKCTNIQFNPLFKEIARFKINNLNLLELSIFNLWIVLRNFIFLMLLNSAYFLLINLYTLDISFNITFTRAIVIILVFFYLADFHINQY